MYELKVAVGKVLGKCTADPPLARGDYFTVRDGDVRIPEGRYICLWALQSLMPLITPKEREICERQDEDWMWRVHHVQCPDPKGRVVFKIERTERIEKNAAKPAPSAPPAFAVPASAFAVSASADKSAGKPAPGGNGVLPNLRVVVEQVKGKCTSHLQPGDFFMLRSGRLYIPAGRHFCLYALHAALPLLPAKQRASQQGDWLAEDDRVICPDPAGNVVMRIEMEPE